MLDMNMFWFWIINSIHLIKLKTYNMQPRKTLSDRYNQNNCQTVSLIEFPKSICKKRIVERAWIWHKNEPGVPGYFNLSLSDALKMSWKTEKDMIKSGGAIYHPYVMVG